MEENPPEAPAFGGLLSRPVHVHKFLPRFPRPALQVHAFRPRPPLDGVARFWACPPLATGSLRNSQPLDDSFPFLPAGRWFSLCLCPRSW